MLAALVVGLVVGALARFFTPGRVHMGLLMTILLGIGGSYVGTFIGRALGGYQNGERAGLIMSVIGAVLLVLAYRRFFAGRAGA